ncbi:MAG: hypothetical protein U1A78_24000 [Polyangia bacterium]
MTGSGDDEGAAGQAAADPGYALGQLARALAVSTSTEPQAVRARAAQRAESWSRVLGGMLSGALSIGSRTPVSGLPGWVTLRVLTGGFATGEALAAGPLLPHELARLAALKLPADETARAALNASFLTESGLAELRALLDSGCYRVEVPEEGALLVLAWLHGHGHDAAAQALLAALVPLLGRLRFYPVPDERPLPPGPTALVHMQTVAEVKAGLEALPENAMILSQREALQVWAPLLDRAVALFVETVEGPLPAVALGPDGRPRRAPDGSWSLTGGWPCQRYPAGWRVRAQALLDEFRALRQKHTRCTHLERPKGNLPRLRLYLERCVADPRSLSGRDVGMIRLILAHIAAARGLPDSPRCQALRTEQARCAARPTKKELSRVVLARLAGAAPDAGLPGAGLELLLAPIDTDEAARLRLPEGQALPEALRPRLARCVDAPITELVQTGVIPSGEVLARVLPQLTSQTSAAGFADPSLRRLYGVIYGAFRRRRSLLLLNLESQVRFTELPWVAALLPLRRDDKDTRGEAHQVLSQAVQLALTGFPQAILPNKLLQELRALSERAGLSLPLVDEIAADIFMGEFTDKFVRAAKQAGALLAGSLYEAYYGLPYDRVQRLPLDESKEGKGGKGGKGGKLRPTAAAAGSRELYALCCELAREAVRGPGSVARNGRILEQEQILTTHNLAVLIAALGLVGSEAEPGPLRPQLGELARRCFTWVCKQQQRRFADWRSRLHMIKNTAYAWRQMLFFLSLLPRDAVAELLLWAESELMLQPAELRARFRPALTGLVRAFDGESPDCPPASRRFLGWADSSWLKPAAPTG